jgi:hypothetical protein
MPSDHDLIAAPRLSRRRFGSLASALRPYRLPARQTELPGACPA